MAENIVQLLTANQHQDIARSSYADMLNDDERNRAFYSAIRISVNSLVLSPEHNPHGERFFQCCDIGTGSGLLSMMIVNAFQELHYDKFHVTAFEAFKPMARCAERVIEANGMSDFITVLATRSNDIGEALFDLLVAELLDTELIGEGCIEVYRHAVENLCSPTCLFVPYEARIYIEPVASSLLFQRHAIDDLKFTVGDNQQVDILVPEEVKNCCGLADVDDVQASSLRENIDFIRISKPQVAFKFIFNDPQTLQLDGYNQLEFKMDKKIEQPPVIIMWWDIVMYDKVLTNTYPDDDSPKIQLDVLSCAPTWARSEKLKKRDQAIYEIYGREVWRDHWIQAIYYFQDVLGTRNLVGKPQDYLFKVHSYHDTHSLWFDLQLSDRTPASCTCGTHRSLSRSQLAFLSDQYNMTKLLATRLPTVKTEPTTYSANIEFRSRPLFGYTIPVEEAPKWKITGQLNLLDLSYTDEIPWEKVLARFFDNLDIDPIESFAIKCTQVSFDNLNRIRTDIRHCEGFNLQELDKMISYSSNVVDKPLESHFLWEYGCKRLDTDRVVYSSLKDNPQQRSSIRRGTYWQNIRFPVRCGFGDWKKSWAIVFWSEFKLKKTQEVLSTGPIKESYIGEKIEWNRYCKQLVYFMHDYPTPPFSNVAVELDVGLNNLYLTVQRAIDYNGRSSQSSS